MLVHAARDFLARGNSPLDLSPFAAVRFGLLDTNAVGDPMRVQTSGYPFVSAARTSRTLSETRGYLVSHGMIRERLAIELGPKHALRCDQTSGIWLGPWTADSIAIGVVAGPQSAATLSARFGRNADAIYYPYPLRYSTHPSSANQAADPQMLLMTFKTASLPALDLSTAPASLTLGTVRDLCSRDSYPARQSVHIYPRGMPLAEQRRLCGRVAQPARCINRPAMSSEDHDNDHPVRASPDGPTTSADRQFSFAWNGAKSQPRTRPAAQQAYVCGSW